MNSDLRDMREKEEMCTIIRSDSRIDTVIVMRVFFVH